jgi:hypothetical protein
MKNDKAIRLQNVTILFDTAWNTYKKYFEVLLKVNYIPVIIGMSAVSLFTFVGGFESFAAYLTKPDFIDIIGLVFGVTTITIVTISVNYIAQVIALSRSTDVDGGGAVSIYSIYKEASGKLFPYFWVMILCGLIIVGGMILLIVPGIIFSVWFAFSSFTFIVGNEKGAAALKKSKQYVRGIWLEVFLRFIAAALLAFLLSAALGVLRGFVEDVFIEGAATTSHVLDFIYQLVVTPYFVVYSYELYKDVVRVNEEMPIEEGFVIPEAGESEVVSH